MVKRQRFTAEFKREAVRLLAAGERPASKVAIDLGIRRNQIYWWKAEQVKRNGARFTFPSAGKGRWGAEMRKNGRRARASVPSPLHSAKWDGGDQFAAAFPIPVPSGI